MRSEPNIVLLALAIAACSPLFAASRGAECSVKGGTFALDLGHTKAPTYAGVVLPNGKLLRLRYPPDNIDTLGPAYEKGRVSMRVSKVSGVDGNGKRKPVFTAPGTYKFEMRDASTAEGMDLHRLQCRVTVTQAQLNAS